MPDTQAQSSSTQATRPTPLSLVIDDDEQTAPLNRSRRPSNGSATSSDDSPLYTALDSTAPLILVHDDDDDEDDRDHGRLTLDFSTDSDDSDDLDDSLSPLYQINGKLSIPPLPPFTIFIYLLSPYLKLGALLLPYYQLPLKYGLTSILVSAVLALVARHLLYLIARYLRKADLEEVVSNTFVSTKKRGRKGERRREFFKFFVRVGTAVLKIFLAVVYLQECVRFTLPLFTSAASSHKSSTELVLALTAVLLALSLSYPGSLASRLVIYTTHLSILTYLLWLACITYLHTQGALPINSERLSTRSIWDGLITTTFIFTSSNTLPLYASTKGTIQTLLFDTNTSLPMPGTSTVPSTGTTMTPRRDGSLKQPLYRSFKILSLLSVVVALGLTLPLVGFAAFPNETPTVPASATANTTTSVQPAVTNVLIGFPDQLPDWRFPFPPGESTPTTRIQTYLMPALASLTLLFGTPQHLITIPTIPTGSLRWFRMSQRRFSASDVVSKLFRVLRKSVVGLLMILLTFISLTFDTSDALRTLTAVLSILATYYIPSVLHVLTHTFKSPLSIILPSTYFSSSFSATPTPVASSRPSTSLPAPVLGPSTSLDDGRSRSSMNDIPPPSTTARGQPSMLSSSSRHRHTQSQQEHDDLLQRKERALQKRQMRRRIIWDIWAWSIFLGGFIVVGLGARMVSGG